MYQLSTSSSCVIKLPEGQIIPDAVENFDWQQYQIWLAEGNTPLPINPDDLIKQCKDKATAILTNTDWTSIADIASSENNPYLINQAEFLTYRNVIRGYAVNPVENPIWPTQPTEQWSS